MNENDKLTGLTNENDKLIGLTNQNDILDWWDVFPQIKDKKTKDKMAEKAAKQNNSESFEQKLWKTADKLRKNIDAAEYKHIVLGLIFLKYISDAFEELHQKLLAGEGEYEGANPEDPEEYSAENVFFVPVAARWPSLQAQAKQPTIGKLVDEAMEAIEQQNLKRLKGILPKVYGQQKLDQKSLGGLIDLIGSITLGDAEAQAQDVLGRVYEYFLGQFALAEGKKGGQFYTPESIVRLLGYSRDTCKMGHVVKFCKEIRLKALILGSVEPEILEAIRR